jgi:prepilin-type N-terminal cleavage/methylation domain-containing protein
MKYLNYMYRLMRKKISHMQKIEMRGFTRTQAKHAYGFAHPHGKFVGGFTLVEMMVSVSIFAIIVTVGIGALFSMNRSYTATRTQQAIMDQLNFALESMAREIRTGSSYYCGSGLNLPSSENDCLSSQNSLSFVNVDGEGVAYAISGSGRIVKRVDNERFDITPEEIEIVDLSFRVIGSDNADTTQPTVIMSVAGNSTFRDLTTNFVIQTSVTQRIPDFQI